MITVKKFTFNPISVNAYLLWDESLEAVLIDPACYFADEEMALSRFVESNKLTVVHLLNTHGHFDHLMGNNFAETKWDLSCRIHPGDSNLVQQAKNQAKLFGMTMADVNLPVRYLSDGEVIHFGQSSLKVIHVPGHSQGSVAFYSETDKIVIVGDILFEGSVGRTDLPGGNHMQLISGIKGKLMTLDDEVKVYSGHGNETTIGREKRTNPFLQ
jgi:glyoxylase-like metal-dependent hydrolase (beta-lactamase superfamily II)